MLWTIVLVILLLWLAGFATDAVGSLIHLLLVVAVAVAIYNLIVSRGRTI